MLLRPIILAAAIVLIGTRTDAQQDVRIEVVEASNGKPIVGANVSVFDSTGVLLGGGFSDQGGHIELPTPARNPFRVQADKVTYDTWLSVVLRPAGKPIRLRIGMIQTRIPGIVGRTETACQQLGGPGTPAGDLWVELRKALIASALTEAQGLVSLDVDLYERALDRNLGIVSERTEQRTKIPRRPATGISWDQLDSARRRDAGGEVYRAPDAATFLSDQFIRSHCFTAIHGYGPESGLSGLEFKPSKIGALPELTGVIWLDPKASTLRYLNFDYVNLPIPLRIARTSGRVDFQQLPGGQWIVPRWYIRMPRTARVTATIVGSPSVVRDSLVGFQEVGGTARPAGTAAAPVAVIPASSSNEAGPAPATAAPAPAQSAVLEGVVYDSTTGRPLKGVVVSTGVGRFKTRTSDGGRYELVIDGALSDKVIFDHPRLRLLRIPERVQTVSVAPGSRGQAVVIIPSYATLRSRLCGQNETGTDAQGMAVGYVKDSTGNAVRNAHVWVTWQVQWIEQSGRLISTNQQRTVETDTGPDGSYMLCGFTKGAQITAKVGMAGKSTVQEKLVIPPSMVLEHDFQIGAR
jgi:hypothetical protein